MGGEGSQTQWGEVGRFFSFLMELLKIANTNQIRSIKFLYLLLQTRGKIQM